MTTQNKPGGSGSPDAALDLHKLHCRYAIRRGLTMEEANQLWREMKPRYSDRNSHMDALVAYLAQKAVAGPTQPAGLSERAPRIPEEVPEGTRYFEGAVRQVTVNAYERDRKARLQCIAHYGAVCTVCGFSFESAYGPDVAGLIHVHHVVPLQDIGETYEVDPIADLRPICPNCHAVVHFREPPWSLSEVASMVRKCGQ